MRDPGYILHVRDGQHFYYLANNGVPFGQLQGPFADPSVIPERAAFMRRLIARHARRQVIRRHTLNSALVAM
jgi:hypothetical protein